MSRKSTKPFSIIIPTYTGEAHIKNCIDNIINQNTDGLIYEVIIVIDGPNKIIKTIANSYVVIFKKMAVDFRIIEFKVNKGRFAARLEGAKVAKFSSLLFIDDRVDLGHDFMQYVSGCSEKIIIPSVIEKSSPALMARSIFLLRKKVYGDKWGKDFKSYYIDKGNFEKSSKGTTSLWVDKNLFINACKEVEKIDDDNKNLNEDTKILKIFVSMDQKMLRSSEAKIYYNPRQESWAELKHIYARGPRFIDYYATPGTRFFPHLIIALLLSVLLIIVFLIMPKLLLLAALIALTIDLIVSIYIATSLRDILISLVFVPALAVFFYSGIVKGLIDKYILIK